MINRKIVLDTETTGLNPKEGHKIIEIGCIELDDNVPTGKEWHSYVNPKRDIPEAATEVHGLEEAFLRDKPLFKEIAEDFLGFLKEDVLVIHNARFDIGFLNHELNIAGLPLLDLEKTIDTMLLARKLSPGAPASLDALCKRFDIDLVHRKKHGALVDAKLLAEVYLELTGGRQGSFVLKKEEISHNADMHLEEKHIEKRKIIKIPLTKEEEEEHEKYIEKISSTIWSKQE